MEQLTAAQQAAELNKKNLFATYNHIEAEFVEPDHAIFKLEIRPESKNPYGIVHGGIVKQCTCHGQTLLSGAARPFDALLSSLRRSRVVVALKAVVTEDNAAWSSLQLHDELRQEHEAMKGTRPKDAEKRSAHRK